jgi:uncharacterized protein (TIGR00251 family)
VILNIRVVPRAARSGYAGRHGDDLLFRLNAPPVEGAANAELVEVLSEVFNVPKRNITIVSGEKSRNKRVSIDGIGADDVARVVGANPKSQNPNPK